MTLNIKDPEAHRLATAISETTGDTLTIVVTKALREQLDRLRRSQEKATAEELLHIARRAAATHEARLSIMATTCTTNAVFPNDSRYLGDNGDLLRGTRG